MKIAITGADGYIGRFLCEALRARGYEGLRCLSRHDHAHGIPMDKVDYSVESLVALLQGVDVVVHLAARRIGQTLSDFSDNERITENLLLAMTEARVRRIVYASSIAVYSDESELPWKETQCPNPATVYGISKLACEYLCRIYAKKHGIQHTIYRLAPIFGSFDEGKRITAIFTRQAIQGQSLHVFGRSIAQREFFYVGDAVGALVWGIENDTGQCETLNVGTGTGATNYEIAQVVNKAFGNSAPLVYHEELDEGIHSSYMDVCTLKERGFMPKYDLQSAFAEIARQMKGTM